MIPTRLTITKKFDFCYGHHLPDYNGPCIRFHGHNSKLEVEISGSHKKEVYAGMLEDFTDLKNTVKKRVIDVLDHRNLNEFFPKDLQPPTIENIAWFIWGELEAVYNQHLVRIKVSETDDSYAEIKVTK